MESGAAGLVALVQDEENWGAAFLPSPISGKKCLWIEVGLSIRRRG
jgi:hypothetical protein